MIFPLSDLQTVDIIQPFLRFEKFKFLTSSLHKEKLYTENFILMVAR